MLIYLRLINPGLTFASIFVRQSTAFQGETRRHQTSTTNGLTCFGLFRSRLLANVKPGLIKRRYINMGIPFHLTIYHYFGVTPQLIEPFRFGRGPLDEIWATYLNKNLNTFQIQWIDQLQKGHHSGVQTPVMVIWRTLRPTWTPEIGISAILLSSSELWTRCPATTCSARWCPKSFGLLVNQGYHLIGRSITDKLHWMLRCQEPVDDSMTSYASSLRHIFVFRVLLMFLAD